MKKNLFFITMLCVVGMQQAHAADQRTHVPSDAEETTCFGLCKKKKIAQPAQPAGAGMIAAAPAMAIDGGDIQIMDFDNLTPRYNRVSARSAFLSQSSSAAFSGDENLNQLPGSLNDDPVRRQAAINSPHGSRQPSPRPASYASPRQPSPRLSLDDAQDMMNNVQRVSFAQLQQAIGNSGQKPVTIIFAPTMIFNAADGNVTHTNLTPKNLTPPSERRAQSRHGSESDSGSRMGSPDSAKRSRRAGAAPAAPKLEGKRSTLPSMSPIQLSSVDIDPTVLTRPDSVTA